MLKDTFSASIAWIFHSQAPDKIQSLWNIHVQTTFFLALIKTSLQSDTVRYLCSLFSSKFAMLLSHMLNLISKMDFHSSGSAHLVAVKACIPSTYPAFLVPQISGSPADSLGLHMQTCLLSIAYFGFHSVLRQPALLTAFPIPSSAGFCQHVFNNRTLFHILEQKYHNSVIQVKIKWFVKRQF